MSYCLMPYLIHFDSLPTNTGSLDGYEFEEALRGEFLPNNQWSSMRMNWFDAVDAALASAGTDVRLSKFFYRGAPCPIIPPDDFPMIGHIKPEEVAPLLNVLSALSVGGAEGDAIAEVHTWLINAAPGQGIVTFYY